MITFYLTRNTVLFSKSTSSPYTYHILVHIFRPHHNSHAMPSRTRSHHSCPIQPQFRHPWPTPWYAKCSLFFYYMSSSTPLFIGSPGDKYESLKELFMESRESLFAYVESATAKFNKWTVESPPLLVARLMAGIFGFLILIGIWSGW